MGRLGFVDVGHLHVGILTMPSSPLLVARDLIVGRPATVEAWREQARARAHAVGRELVPDDRTLIAYVNWGRWIADCPYCGSGIMLDPTWSEANCFGDGCYHVYAAFLWPTEAERASIEGALVVRQQKHQHWGNERGITRDPATPVESIEDLWRENVERLAPYATAPLLPTPHARDRGNRNAFDLLPLLPDPLPILPPEEH